MTHIKLKHGQLSRKDIVNEKIWKYIQKILDV